MFSGIGSVPVPSFKVWLKMLRAPFLKFICMIACNKKKVIKWLATSCTNNWIQFS
jgi:hypothetical protein